MEAAQNDLAREKDGAKNEIAKLVDFQLRLTKYNANTNKVLESVKNDLKKALTEVNATRENLVEANNAKIALESKVQELEQQLARPSINLIAASPPQQTDTTPLPDSQSSTRTTRRQRDLLPNLGPVREYMIFISIYHFPVRFSLSFTIKTNIFQSKTITVSF